MNSVLEIVKRININSPILVNEIMSKHTTFKTGGPAEVFIKAHSIKDIKAVIKCSRENNIPLFVLGGGANILVSDKGIPGITLYLGELDDIVFKDNQVTASAGVIINRLCEEIFNRGFSGFEFIYGMPGTLGGAMWMNARCYGEEISDSFVSGEYITREGEIITINKNMGEWDYKKSPFQLNDIVILNGTFKLREDDQKLIKNKMEKNFRDRREKGHFKFPCAGSIFKNNRAFGSPSGKIIEDAGIKGLKHGGAMISDFHGNIIINCGSATSSDINYLIEQSIKTVKEKFGFTLEPEVIKVGDWS